MTNPAKNYLKWRSQMTNSTDARLPSEKELRKQIMITNEVVWKNLINRKDIENWLSNFKGDVFEISYERQLALWLLANFVFYNYDEVRHLCKTLYRDFIHQMLSEEKETNEGDIKNKFKSILKISRFYHLGKPGKVEHSFFTFLDRRIIYHLRALFTILKSFLLL